MLLFSVFSLLFVLPQDYPERAHLIRNSIIKLVVVFSAIAVAITFGVLYSQCGGREFPSPEFSLSILPTRLPLTQFLSC